MKKTVLPLLASFIAAGLFGQSSVPKTTTPAPVTTSATTVKTTSPKSSSGDLTRPLTIGGFVFAKDFPTAAKIFSHNTQGWKNPITPGLTGFLSKGLSPKIDFLVGLDATITEYKKSDANFYYTKLKNNTLENVQKLYLEGDALINFKFATDDKMVVPYLTGGVTLAMYNNSLLFPYATGGGGVQFKLSEGAFLFAQTLLRVGLSNPAKENLTYSIGTAFYLKKKVMAKVVPIVELDTDKDSIPDSRDKCPTIPGIAKYFGCPIPDTDNDGVNDEQDSCINIPGIAKYHGCPIPDTDKDGINDEDDKCPTVPGIAKYNGCPIPDTDGDGINDEEDKCPNEPGIKANNGCPEIQNKMNELAKSIYFTPGGSTISPKAFGSLDQVVSLMQKYTAFKLEIEGHTDNVGSPIANQKISQKRADAIKGYFISKGIDAGRLYAIGYGLERPIANNKTVAGRALNRRVELKAKY
ncbi:OmpA family protein [Parasediminibacterium sp. JCM 36343]|uniref:OmpA family protein n=1 Tax=Parasediminibacterium sp. JCM 36343 TaxID=3374279 RepID=UPI003978659D